MGMAYGRSGRTGQAIDAFKQATQVKPSDAESWHFLGIDLKRNGQCDEAIVAFKKEIELKPDSITRRDVGD